MGRPIKKEFIGGINVPSGKNMIVLDSAFIPGASSVSSNVQIVSQKGTGRYIVTDGTNTGLVTLVDGANGYVPVSGEAISKVELYSTENETVYTPASLKLNNGGTGYKVNDVLTVKNSGTFKVETVTEAVTGGEILTGTPTLSTTQYTVNNAGDSVTSTGGTGTGATFKVTTTSNTTYLPKTITLNAAGTGYAVNDTVTLTNIGTVTITAIGTDGAISTFSSVLNDTPETTNMAGTGIAQNSTSGSGSGATFDVTSTSTTVYPIASITLVNAGSGYTVNDVLTIGDSLATYKVETVSTAVTGGEILTGTPTLSTTQYTTDMSGTKIASTGGTGTGATFDVTSTSSSVTENIIEYASKIFNRTVVTFEDGVYAWDIDVKANQPGEANLTTIPKP